MIVQNLHKKYFADWLKTLHEVYFEQFVHKKLKNMKKI